MAISPQLLQFKSSGVYRLEFDKSQTSNINVETLRLRAGHSKKGPYNTPKVSETQIVNKKRGKRRYFCLIIDKISMNVKIKPSNCM